MPRTALKARIGISLTALGGTWLLAGVAVSFYYKDVRALVDCWIWSTPFFAAGWVVFGIPLIALSERIPIVPAASLLLGVAGALVGGLVMLSPAIYVRWMSPNHWVPFAWTDLTGWPAAGAGAGSAGALFYWWLLSRYDSPGR